MRFFSREVVGSAFNKVKGNYDGIIPSYLSTTFGNNEATYFAEVETLKSTAFSSFQSAYNAGFNIQASFNPWMWPLTPYADMNIVKFHLIKAIGSVFAGIVQPVFYMLIIPYYLVALVVSALADLTLLLTKLVMSTFMEVDVKPNVERLANNISYYSFQIIIGVLDTFISLIRPFAAFGTLVTRGAATVFENYSTDRRVMSV